MRKINEIIIHCTATKPNWWASRSTKQKVAEIRRWHVEDNGWSDIGYHYLIDRNGKVEEGRPLEKAGAHVKGRNANSIGISLFGGHGSSAVDQFADHFTQPQDEALRGLLDTLEARFGAVTVSGHNQYANKACPAFSVPHWRDMRPPQRDNALSSGTVKATAGAAVTGAGGVFMGIGNLDPLAQVAVIVLLAGMLSFLAYIYISRRNKQKRGIL